MPATSIRHTVRAALVAKLAAHPSLAGVQVEIGWPGDQLEGESVWLDETSGANEIPTFNDGRKTRDDDFTVPVEFQAGTEGQEMTDAEARVCVLYASLEDILANDPTLAINGVLWAVMGDVRGPVTARTKQGAVSFMRATVNVKVRET